MASQMTTSSTGVSIPDFRVVAAEQDADRDIGCFPRRRSHGQARQMALNTDEDVQMALNTDEDC